MFLTKIYLTFFYTGLSKKASGTIGSVAALPFAYLTLYYLNQFYLTVFSLIIFFISIKIIDNYEKVIKIHDAKEIVIDEVCGVFLAIALSYNNHLWHFILAFILFRFFDITKPSIIGRIDKKVKGGLGVMLDDLLAGFFAAMLCLIFQGLLAKLF